MLWTHYSAVLCSETITYDRLCVLYAIGYTLLRAFYLRIYGPYNVAQSRLAKGNIMMTTRNAEIPWTDLVAMTLNRFLWRRYVVTATSVYITY